MSQPLRGDAALKAAVEKREEAFTRVKAKIHAADASAEVSSTMDEMLKDGALRLSTTPPRGTAISSGRIGSASGVVSPASPAGSELVGIGCSLSKISSGEQMIVSVKPGGVADVAGISRGSIITKVNGIEVRGKSAREIGRLTMGPPGSSVTVEVRVRAGDKCAEYTLVRRATIDSPMSFAGDRGHWDEDVSGSEHRGLQMHDPEASPHHRPAEALLVKSPIVASSVATSRPASWISRVAEGVVGACTSGRGPMLAPISGLRFSGPPDNELEGEHETVPSAQYGERRSWLDSSSELAEKESAVQHASAARRGGSGAMNGGSGGLTDLRASLDAEKGGLRQRVWQLKALLQRLDEDLLQEGSTVTASASLSHKLGDEDERVRLLQEQEVVRKALSETESALAEAKRMQAEREAQKREEEAAKSEMARLQAAQEAQALRRILAEEAARNERVRLWAEQGAAASPQGIHGNLGESMSGKEDRARLGESDDEEGQTPGHAWSENVVTVDQDTAQEEWKRVVSGAGHVMTQRERAQHLAKRDYVESLSEDEGPDVVLGSHAWKEEVVAVENATEMRSPEYSAQQILAASRPVDAPRATSDDPESDSEGEEQAGVGHAWQEQQVALDTPESNREWALTMSGSGKTPVPKLPIGQLGQPVNLVPGKVDSDDEDDEAGENGHFWQQESIRSGPQTRGPVVGPERASLSFPPQPAGTKAPAAKVNGRSAGQPGPRAETASDARQQLAVLNKMGSDDEADEGQGHATWALEHVGGGAGSRGNGDAHGQNGAGAVTDEDWQRTLGKQREVEAERRALMDRLGSDEEDEGPGCHSYVLSGPVIGNPGTPANGGSSNGGVNTQQPAIPATPPTPALSLATVAPQNEAKSAGVTSSSQSDGGVKGKRGATRPPAATTAVMESGDDGAMESRGSDLPEGWKEMWSRSKSRPYYKNRNTGEVTWYHPRGKSGGKARPPA